MEKDNMRTALKGMNLTGEEVRKFENAFRDKEFIKLFEDYAREISDPMVQEETEQYLRQLEAEGHAEEVYGKGVQLVIPKAQFVVKLRNAGSRIFINVCSSEKMDKPTSSSSREGARRGTHFQIPLMLGSKKAGQDKKQQSCDVWDFVVHPDAVLMAHSNVAFRDLLVHTAIEKIEEVHNLKLGKSYRILAQQYKAANGHKKPQVLAVRTGSGGEVHGGHLKPMPDSQQCVQASSNCGSKDADKPAAKPAAKSMRSAFKPSFAPPVSSTNTLPHEAGYKHSTGEITPAWTIVHRGELDLVTAWGDAGRTIPVNFTCPKELVVKVHLPDVTSVAAMALDVDKQSISLTCPGKYKLKLTLPHPVQETEGQAKFHKNGQHLELVLPVLPLPMPELPFRGLATGVAKASAYELQCAADMTRQNEQPSTATDSCLATTRLPLDKSMADSSSNTATQPAIPATACMDPQHTSAGSSGPTHDNRQPMDPEAVHGCAATAAEALIDHPVLECKLAAVHAADGESVSQPFEIGNEWDSTTDAHVLVGPCLQPDAANSETDGKLQSGGMHGGSKGSAEVCNANTVHNSTDVTDMHGGMRDIGAGDRDQMLGKSENEKKWHKLHKHTSSTTATTCNIDVEASEEKSLEDQALDRDRVTGSSLEAGSSGTANTQNQQRQTLDSRPQTMVHLKPLLGSSSLAEDID